jgi:hypothetical protein
VKSPDERPPDAMIFTLIEVDETELAAMEAVIYAAMDRECPLLIIADSPDAEALVETAPFMTGPLTAPDSTKWLMANKGRFAVAWT